MVSHKLGSESQLTFTPNGVRGRVRFSLSDYQTHSPTGVFVGPAPSRVAV